MFIDVKAETIVNATSTNKIYQKLRSGLCLRFWHFFCKLQRATKRSLNRSQISILYLTHYITHKVQHEYENKCNVNMKSIWSNILTQHNEWVCLAGAEH